MAWDLSRAAYDNKVFHAGGSEGGYMARPANMYLYSAWKWGMVDWSPNKIFEFWMSNGRIETSSFNNWFEVDDQLSNPYSWSLSRNGSKMYVVGGILGVIHQYTLSESWKIATAVYDDVSFNPTEAPHANVLRFGDDDSKMYVLGEDDVICQYTLSTPGDINTAIYSGFSLDLSEVDKHINAMCFSPDGDKLFVVRLTDINGYTSCIRQYTLSTPWRISTATFDMTFDVTTQISRGSGLEFKPDGSKMYVVGFLDACVYQYSLVFVPEGTTQSLTNIQATSATGNGNITDDGGGPITVRGFCYMEGTSGDPTTADSKVYDSGSFGTGAYTKLLTGLSSATNYRVRAYFTNPAGTGYGDTVQLLTTPAAPTNVAATDGVHTDKVVITWTKSTGAADYQVYRNGTPLGWLGDVDTFDDTEADAPTITPGSTVASDGVHTDKIALGLSGTVANNGTTHTYKVKAKNATGESVYSSTNAGYRAPGTLNYQWQKSAEDSDDNYSNIDGATSDTYNDTDAPAPTITPGAAVASDGGYVDHVALSLSGHSANVGEGRFYKCILNAEGCAQQISSSDRGYRDVGSLTFQWQKSIADSDADYSNIDGATTDPYNDTEAPENGDGRYYKCIENAEGATQQTSTVDRGYRIRLVHFRAYVIDAEGNFQYGEDKTFTFL